MSLNIEKNNLLRISKPITNTLGSELIKYFTNEYTEVKEKFNDPNNTINTKDFIINVQSFRKVLQPVLTDFIYQYFAVENNKLILLFRLNNQGRYFEVNGNGEFSAIADDANASTKIDAYKTIVGENTVGYSKCLWSEYNSEMDTFFIPSNIVEWKVQFGYVHNSLKTATGLTSYEIAYLNTYHDHLTAVSKIITSNGEYYRDADIICPPRCGVL